MLNGNNVSINLSLDLYSIGVCIIIIASILHRKHGHVDKPSKWFAITCCLDIIFSIADMFCWLSEGNDAQWKIIVLPIANFCYYVFGQAIFVTYLYYLISYYSNYSKINNLYGIIGQVSISVLAFLLILTPKFGLLYTVSPTNNYVRGPFFWVCTFVDILFYIEMTIMVIQNRKKVPGHQTFAFSSFIFIPIFFWIIQLFNYGIALNNVGITFSFFILFINLNQRLEEKLDHSTNELKLKNKTIIDMQDNTIMSLSNLVENRDTDTGHHVRRTRDYVTLLAQQCIKDRIYVDTITDLYITLLGKSAPLHDIGKIVVPDYVLKKPGKLTTEEFQLMQKHAKEGGRIINEVLGIGIDQEYLRIATEISTGHHERWDGTGYPYKLIGTAIPLSARLMAIADVFDALVSKRCYKDSMSIDEAFKIIKEESGTHFDPVLVEEFLKIKDDITYVVKRFVD